MNDFVEVAQVGRFGPTRVTEEQEVAVGLE